MAKITSLPALAPEDVDGSETLPVVKAGATRQVPAAPLVEALAQPFVNIAAKQASIATSAALAAESAGNYKSTFDQALDAFEPGEAFVCPQPTAENPAGEDRRYLRTVSAPGYELTADQPLSGRALASTGSTNGSARVGFRHQLRTSVSPQTLYSKVSQLQANVEDYRQDGDTDDGLVSRAIASCEADGLTLVVSQEYSLSATITCEKLRLHGDGGLINGFDGTGFLLSGQECVCTITGDLTFAGFEDAGNWKFQKSNFDTCAIRLGAASKIISGYLGPQLLFRHCRTGFKAAANGAESTRDGAQHVANFLVDGADFEYGAGGFRIRCDFSNVHVRHATVRHMRSASRTGLAAIEIFSSGNPADVPESTNTAVSVSFCSIYDVVQLTTTGTSLAGNNYECCGIRVSGYLPKVIGNTLRDITGVKLDCEGIYTKSRGALVANNTLRNAGSLEGAIAVKGAAPGATGAGQNPGHQNHILGNEVVFDEYEYTHTDPTYDSSGTQIHASGEVVPLVRRSFYIASPLWAKCDGNTSVGSNERDFYVYPGPLAAGGDEGVGFTGVANKSINNRSGGSVVFSGGLQDVRFQIDIIDPEPPVGVHFKAISMVEVADRGVTYNNIDLSNCSLTLNSENLSGMDVCLLNVVGGAQFNMDLLRINDCKFDVIAPDANIYAMICTASGAVSKTWDNFEMMGWSIKRPIANTLFGIGSWRPRSYTIDVSYDVVTKDNSIVNLATMAMTVDAVAVSDFRAVACRVDAPGTAAYFESKSVFWGNAGTATEIGAPGIVNTISAISGVSAAISPSGSTLRVQLNGNAAETYRWQVRHHLRQSAAVAT